MNADFIPVDLLNPGQVFASLGFLEAADTLCGPAEGGFDWSGQDHTCFVLTRAGSRNPFEVVLEFLAAAKIFAVLPCHSRDGSPDNDIAVVRSPCFPTAQPERMALPVRLERDGQHLTISHWSDGSTRDDFKLYAGNRSAARIVRAMLRGDEKKATKGVQALWQDQAKRAVENPFDLITAIGGSFNFDPRGGWTRLDAGYSPDEQGHLVAASPVVEILAAIGLEHARPQRRARSEGVRYGVWSGVLPPSIARAALGCCEVSVPVRRFQFTVATKGKNKAVTFAREDIAWT